MITWGVLSPGIAYCFCNFGDGVYNSRFIYVPPCRRGCFNEKEMAIQQRVTVREYAGIWPLEDMNLGCSFRHVWPLVTVDWSSQEDPVRFFFKAKLLWRFYVVPSTGLQACDDWENFPKLRGQGPYWQGALGFSHAHFSLVSSCGCEVTVVGELKFFSRALSLTLWV